MAIGMSRREQWALIGVVALIALGAGIQAWRSSNTGGPVVYVPGQGRWEKVADFEAGKRPDPLPGRTSESGAKTKAGDRATTATEGGIDLNRATLEELDRLPGIGAARAAAILELRGRLGGFSSVEQLDQVSGIGAKSLERLRPYVRVSAHPASTPIQAATSTSVTQAAPSGRRTAATSASKAPTPAPNQTLTLEMVDINRAGAEELQKIKGIGPALAGRIVEDRNQHGPYLNAEALTRVKGIGPVSLQKMKPQILIAPIAPVNSQ